MAQYQNLAELRQALTSDDAEVRSQAYGTVYEETDVEPSEVLQNDDIEAYLQEAGVVETPEDRRSAYDQRERIIELLEAAHGGTE